METQRERNYYELLGLPVGATEEQIKQAYHELARKYHPDKALEPDEAERFEQEFALISRAYNTLKDADKRKLYLDMLKREKERSVKPVERPIPTTTKVRAPTADKASIAKKSFLRGMQFFGAKDYNKAIEFFEVAIKNNEAESEYLIKMAQAFMFGRKSFTKAVEYCKKAIDLDPYNIEYKLCLAELYERVGSTSLAQNVYQEILKWDSTNQVAMARLSQFSRTGTSFLQKIFPFLRKK